MAIARKCIAFIEEYSVALNAIVSLGYQLTVPNQLSSVFKGVLLVNKLALMEHTMRNNKCRLRTELDEGAFIFGSIHELSQMVTNLVTKAVDAGVPDGGDIVVMLYKNENGSTIVSEEDTGRSILPGNLSATRIRDGSLPVIPECMERRSLKRTSPYSRRSVCAPFHG